MHLLAQTDFQSWTDVIILPAIALLFGVLVYAIGARREYVGEKGTWRWLGVAILALACYIGFNPFWNMVSSSADAELYRLSLAGLGPARKMKIAHYAGFLMPLVCLMGTFVVEWWMKRQGQQDY